MPSDNSLTPESLAELKRKAEAATPGPWFITHEEECFRVQWQVGLAITRTYGNSLGDEQDAHFIAAANPQTVLALIARIEADAVDKNLIRAARDSYKESYAIVLRNGQARINELSEENAQLRAQVAAQAGEIDGLKKVPVTSEIRSERLRQIEQENWSVEHDDEHIFGEIARAASAYALAGSWPTDQEDLALARTMEQSFGHDARTGREHILEPIRCIWPWDWTWWKPAGGRRRNLIKAGALIVAEIERIDRAAARPIKTQEPTP